jgi:16S rRNA (adenine1518-N6/adenine1519-N6)-dimethyltransferase
MSEQEHDGREHRARKRFGQHFLHDPAVVRRIVAAIAPRLGDALVEIGPGTGILTAALLDELSPLHAVEIDRDLARGLAARFAGRGLSLHLADALRFDFATLAPGPAALRVVGNLPYNISTPLLFHLLAMRDCIRDMHFMLQREVVTRLAAAPGSRDYGRLSVMVQLHCSVEPLFRVGPGAFRPAPRVESAVVRLQPHRTLPLDPQQLPVLALIVTRAFGQRRKTLRNALQGTCTVAEMEAVGVDPSARPETLSVSAYAALAGAVAARAAAGGSCG